MGIRLTAKQADLALRVCGEFPARTGMYVVPVSWATIDAFWSGFVTGWPLGAHRELQDFANARLGPSNLAWTRRLYGAHSAGESWDQELDRTRGYEVATLICSMISDFVKANHGG